MGITKCRQECSYVELVADRVQPAQQFVVHFYYTEFHNTVEALEWHAEARKLPDTTAYWINTFAHRPWGFEKDLSQDIREFPNVRALHCSLGCVAILNHGSPSDAKGNILDRMWCILEFWWTMAN